MKKKTAKKLTLSRETLRALVDKSLGEIRGETGTLFYSNCYYGSACTCQTTTCV